MIVSERPLALVTGASSGIGAHLARELAKDGHDLILVARRAGPMQALADELGAGGAHITILAADLSATGAAAHLVQEVRARALTIDVLINAAGLGDNGRFDQSDPARIAEMLQVNAVTLTELTRLLLPGMVERGRGKIMLVASTAAFQPGPHMAVYCASKAYVLNLGEAIAYELRRTGVTVTTLCPGPTATEFAKTAKAESSTLFRSSLVPVMSAAAVARIGYKALKSGRRVVITGALNTVIAVSGRLSPHGLSMAIGSHLMSPPESA
jgi:short-subunit dehydrogenase